MSSRAHEDPGLQPERTSLAWHRTVLAILVAAATMLRWAGQYPGIILALVLVLIGLAVVLMVTDARRYRREASAFAQERSAPNVLAVVLLTSCMVIFGASEVAMMVITVR